MCETVKNAVSVRDVCFSYFNSEPILKGINLSVEKDNIYGLLGASGCGKTTLLKCILGRLKPNSGEIQIFGSKPGSPESQIPGAGVGYMPQELGLYFDFTINEVLTYYGRIYGMTNTEIKEKVEELMKLLELKNKNKTISKLSGGQQRRVSMACALIHNPPFLILDEPTVGTDPVLRQSIWFHLMSLCKSGHTIILTTHYIEEARNTKTVAFMRNGTILTEENPDVLLHKYNAINLEEVLLSICYSANRGQHQTDETAVDIEPQKHCYQNGIVDDNSETEGKDSICPNGNSTKRSKFQNIEQNSDENNNKEKLVINWMDNNNNQLNGYNSNSKDSSLTSLERRKSLLISKCSAILIKNFKRITRNLGHLLFEVIFTSLLVMLVLIFIGDGPTNLNLAIYDEEIVNNVTHRWGELYIELLDKERFNLHYFKTFEAAIDSVKSGENHAAIEIGDRFTKSFRLKLLYLTDTDEETLQDSQIYVYIDRSSQLVGLQIEAYLFHGMVAFVKEIANRSNISPELLKIPLVLEEPIYGKQSDSLREYVLPGAYIILQFYATAIITTHLIIEEKKDGLIERSIVAGITGPQFLISNFLTQIPIICFQIIFLLLLPYVLFNRQISGSLPLFISLLLSQAFCGVTYGLVIAVIFSDIMMAALVVVFTFFGSILAGGVLWPIENMPPIVQTFTQLMPNTISIKSMRDIMYREWTIDYFEVYMGFISSYIWVSIFFIIALVTLKRTF